MSLPEPSTHHKKFIAHKPQPPPTSNLQTPSLETRPHHKPNVAQSLSPQTTTPILNYNPPITTPPYFTFPTPSSYPTASSTTTNLPISSNQNLKDKVTLQGPTIDIGLRTTRLIRTVSRLNWLNDYI